MPPPIGLSVVRAVDDVVGLATVDYRLSTQRVAYGVPVPQVGAVGPPRVLEKYCAPVVVGSVAHPSYRLGAEEVVAEGGVLGVPHRSAAEAAALKAVGVDLVALYERGGLGGVNAARDDRGILVARPPAAVLHQQVMVDPEAVGHRCSSVGASVVTPQSVGWVVVDVVVGSFVLVHALHGRGRPTPVCGVGAVIVQVGVQQLARHVGDAEAGVIVDGEVLQACRRRRPIPVYAFHSARYVDPPEHDVRAAQLDDVLQTGGPVPYLYGGRAWRARGSARYHLPRLAQELVARP